MKLSLFLVVGSGSGEQVLRKARKEKPVGSHVSEDVAFSTLNSGRFILRSLKLLSRRVKLHILYSIA